MERVVLTLGCCAILAGSVLVWRTPLEPALLLYARMLHRTGTYDEGTELALREQLRHWLGVMMVSAGALLTMVGAGFAPALSWLVIGVVFGVLLAARQHTRALHGAIDDLRRLRQEPPADEEPTT